MLKFAGLSNIPLSQWWVVSPFEYPPLTCSASTSRGQEEISVGEDGELQHYEIMLIIILESQMMTAKVRYDRFCYHGGNASSLDSRMSGPSIFFCDHT